MLLQALAQGLGGEGDAITDLLAEALHGGIGGIGIEVERMHDLIGDVHPAIAAAMTFADHTPVELGRLAAERRSEARRQDEAP